MHPDASSRSLSRSWILCFGWLAACATSPVASDGAAAGDAAVADAHVVVDADDAAAADGGPVLDDAGHDAGPDAPCAGVVCPAPTDACHTNTCQPTTGACEMRLIDADADGFAAATLGACGTDCDDGDPEVSPGATERIADGVDQDCDGTERCYLDEDHDGFRLELTVNSSDLACATSSGGATAGQPIDCNDLDATIHQGAFETVGDEIDQDCDGTEYCFADTDVDGFTSGVTIMSADADCRDPGEARLGAGIDCCDGDARVFPGQATAFGAADGASACGGWDFDCDGAERSALTTLAACRVGSGSVPACMFVNGGWSRTVPACGASGPFVTNCTGAGSCTQISSPRDQLCR